MEKMRKSLLLCLMIATLTLCCFMTACGKDEKIVELDKTTATVEVGSAITLKATVAGVVLDEIVWKSDKTEIAKVVGGVVTGVKAGSATISASIGASVATCVVTVTPLITISVEPTAVTLAKGANVTLVPTISGATGSATWLSSDTNVATVSDSGLVTAVNAGTATITASIGGKTATCVVTVQAVTITLDKTTLALFDDGVTSTLTEVVTNSTDTVVWSSNATGVATVADGVVTPVSAGSATISASVGGETATCEVTVKAVTITIDETATIYMTKTKQLTANIGDYTGAIEWSSDANGVATVADGLLTPVSAGSATITASVAGKTDTCAVTVKVAPTLSLNVQSAKLDFSGITGSKKATVVASVTGETTPAIAWTSSSASVATVVGGVITARGAGTATITADFNGFTSVCEVVVKDYTGYTLINTPNQFKNISKNTKGNYVLGNNIDFGAKHIDNLGTLEGILDGNGYSVSNFIVGAKSAEDFTVQEGKLWTDTPFAWKGLFGTNYGTIKNIAFTGAKGYFPGNNCGVISAENYGVIENVLLETEVNYCGGSRNVGGIAGTNGTYEGKTGSIKNCVVIASSSIGAKGLSVPDNDKNEWGKASQGLIVGRFAAGEIKNCYTASKTTSYTSDKLFGGNMVGVGSKGDDNNPRPNYIQLAPADNCANKTVDELKTATLYDETWNKEIWNIDSTNTNLPTLKNEAKIAPTIVEFLDTDGKFVDNKLTVQAVVNTNDTIAYSSGDDTIATINPTNGVITAVRPGTVTITATAGEKTATIDIVISLVWNNVTARRLKEGARETLAYEADASAIITWKSNNDSIAMVDTGVVSAVGDGSPSITATINGVDTVLSVISCFTVKIRLDKTTAEVMMGSTITLVATKEETTELVVWSSADTAIATVLDGVVTPVKVGFVDIKATVEGKVATCRVEVRAVPAFTLNKSVADIYIVDGTKETFTLSIIPDTQGAQLTPIWRSKDTAIATVDAVTGVVTAVASGTTQIRATVGETYREATITVISAKGINTKEQFLAIKDGLNANYVLTGDIDFGATFIANMGEFRGKLDGRGHKISNFTLGKATLAEWLTLKRFNWDGPADSSGIFSDNYGTIKNMSITNVVSFVGYSFGIISCNNYGTIENILVESDFYSHADTLRNAGGISGTNGTTGIVRNCIVKLTAKSHIAMSKWIIESIPSTSADAAKNKGFTVGCLDTGIGDYGVFSQGLIVGRVNGGTVENCYGTTTRIWDASETDKTADIFGGNLVGTKSVGNHSTCVKKEVDDLKTATLFGDTWNKDIWNIVEGSQPTLKLC